MRHRNAALAALISAVCLSIAAAPALADSSISVAGSTALLPLVKDSADAYQGAHHDVKIAVTGGGSGTGIAQASAKAVDIGDSDILAPDHPELKDNRVAVTGFAIVTNPGVNVKNLTKRQIQDIFSGKVANWKELGGADVKVVVVNRPRSSGTRVVFTKTLMGSASVIESGLTEAETGTVVSVVKQTPGAVSYAAFSGTHTSGLAEVSIDGVAATDANVITGKYAFWSYEHMFTNGAASGEVAKFIDFVRGQRDLIAKSGYIALKDMKVSETDR